MYTDRESVYLSSSEVKLTSETLGKKLIRYLCFIPVDFIYSCYHLLKKSNFGLEKNNFRSIDLAPVVQRLDNAIHWINRYPVDKC